VAYGKTDLPAEKLWQIPYAVDTGVYRPTPERQRKDLRRRLELPPDARIVLFVGGLNPRKGVHHLIDAFAAVASREPGSLLLLVGPADKYGAAYVESLHSAVQAHRLGDRVKFVSGLADNVADYMRSADLFCLPSEREGLPISILEAMACGLPIVASDIPEIRGVQVNDGEHGLLVPVGDVDRLAGAIGALLSDGATLYRMGLAARSRAEREFASEVVDRRYQDMYSSLLGRLQ
jgi:glycosyltransferase involved in cell wall biosynthesis